MQFQTYKISEQDNGYFLYTISSLSDPELVLETMEFSIANEPQKQMNQYLMTSDFDKVICEQVSISPIDVINNTLPQDDKCINVSSSYISLIPPPKIASKRVPKPKAETKKAKPKGKKVCEDQPTS